MLPHPVTFALEGQTYIITNTLPAMTQAKIFRKVFPVVTELAGIVLNQKETAMKLADKLGKGDTSPPMDISYDDLMMKVIVPFTSAFSKISDEDQDYIFKECLVCVKRKQPNDAGAYAIWDSASGSAMVQDIHGLQLYYIVGQVLWVNYGTFMLALLAQLRS